MGAEQTPAEARDNAADRRDDAAQERDDAARLRDEVAQDRDTEAQALDEASRKNRRSEAGRLAERRLRDDRAATVDDRRLAAEDRDATDRFLQRLREYEVRIAADRRAAAADRIAAAEDRRAAAHDRQLALWARQQAAVEAAEMTTDELGRSQTLPPRGADPGETAQALELNEARRAGLEQQDAAVRSARQAAELAGDIAESEERVAATLRRLAARGGSTAARRLELAEQATIGMHAAAERGVRLRELAEHAGDDLVTNALRALLSHAHANCAALAETERSIATAWESLAVRARPDAAAAYRREAQRAHAAAAAAARRAQELHRSQLDVTHFSVEHENRSEPTPDQ